MTYYWRFLETWDENFPYSEKIPPPQGFWNIHGMGLPDDVLKKIYYQNYFKLVPQAKQAYEQALPQLEKARTGSGN